MARPASPPMYSRLPLLLRVILLCPRKNGIFIFLNLYLENFSIGIIRFLREFWGLGLWEDHFLGIWWGWCWRGFVEVRFRSVDLLDLFGEGACSLCCLLVL